MTFDLPGMGHVDVYRLLQGAVLPRPIAFVSTRSADGVNNLAPFSFFNVVCADPPTICFSPMRRGPQALKKDSLVNIETTGEFVVNVVDESFVGPMNQCSADFEPDESEWVACGLTAVASEVVAPPRVGESPIQMECKLRQVVEISDRPGGGSLVIGEVVRMHVRDDLLDNGRILMERWKPIGRAAGATYVRCTDTFDLPRPAVPSRPETAR
jgi:flavin reductase (DIM6/NTAB) family NADH-FMN oxidoreductase RutF